MTFSRYRRHRLSLNDGSIEYVAEVSPRGRETRNRPLVARHILIETQICHGMAVYLPEESQM